MPKVKVAANIIRAEKEKNASKRAIKVKTTGDRHLNQNEVLKFRSDRRDHDDDPFKPGMNDIEDPEDEDGYVTITNSCYESMKEDKNYIFTMQPDLIVEEEIEDLDDDEKESDSEKLVTESDIDKGDSYQDKEVSIEEVDTIPKAQQSDMKRSLSLNTESATQLTLEMKKESIKDDQIYHSKTKERWYIISCQTGRFGKFDPNNPDPGVDYLFFWQVFVMTLAIYNSFITPFQFSFEYIQELLEKQPLNTIEQIIDIIYMIDIAVGFQTSYIDEFTGDEVTKPSLIARRYLAADLPIDVLSTVPFKQICVHVFRMA